MQIFVVSYFRQKHIVINLISLPLRNPTHNEETYGTELNGITHQAPPWPQPQIERENMFLLPKQLSLNDHITLTGNLLSNPKM